MSSAGVGGDLGGAFSGETPEGSCRFDECPGCPVCREHYDSRWAFCAHLVADPMPYEWVEQPCPREGLVAVCIEVERSFIHYYYQGEHNDLDQLELTCEEIDGSFIIP